MYVAFVKQRFVLTHRHAVLQEAYHTIIDRSSTDQLLNMLCFTKPLFCGHIFTESVSFNCLVMRKSQFDELYGLRQTAI
jgi:hypothetical protein